MARMGWPDGRSAMGVARHVLVLRVCDYGLGRETTVPTYCTCLRLLCTVGPRLMTCQPANPTARLVFGILNKRGLSGDRTGRSRAVCAAGFCLDLHTYVPIYLGTASVVGLGREQIAR